MAFAAAMAKICLPLKKNRLKRDRLVSFITGLVNSPVMQKLKYERQNEMKRIAHLQCSPLITRHSSLPQGSVLRKNMFFAKRTQSCSMFTVEFEKIQSQLKPFQSQKNPKKSQFKPNSSQFCPQTSRERGRKSSRSYYPTRDNRFSLAWGRGPG
jgi:hypothetical protein